MHFPALRALAIIAAAAGGLAVDAPVLAQTVASPWATGVSSRMRLVDAGRLPDGQRLAAVEIEMESGVKTYWRDPGESGVPPVFDWSGSQNVASVHVHYPAPRRFEGPGGFYVGYTQRVALPVAVSLRDPGSPAQLRLKLDYAVCDAICIPVRGEVTLPLDDSAGVPAGLANALMATVPNPQPIGAAGPLAVETVRFADSQTLLAEVRGEAAETASLAVFVEGPRGWFFGKPKRRTGDGRPGLVAFAVPVLERPSGREPVEVVLTLVGRSRAIETRVSLDGGSGTP